VRGRERNGEGEYRGLWIEEVQEPDRGRGRGLQWAFSLTGKAGMFG